MAAVIDQINTRVDPALKASYDAAAATIGTTASSLFREVLENALPEIRARAEAAAKTRGKWPGSVPAALVEQELESLMRSISRSEPLTLLPSELHGARARAVLQLLTWIWGDAAPGDKSHKKLSDWLESLNIKATVEPLPPPGAPKPAPPSKPVKNYPRRGE